MDQVIGTGRYLQHSDGTWSMVGLDGWLVDVGDLHAEVVAAIAAVTMPVIDVDPISVQDNEMR
ncbi:Uncharacterised protein [Nocardia otitidiscaviarum]|uniref:Uncharacterized protein n=1 Tax=Nocardia otitidiscaviarum TaxID=1823 RepID=A0A378YGP3_9NOCA|nr:hypothetical protein [Nocardia otitidiscaviarum]SUA76365.1 Uncharacterised protein [Nocardia otitidiscaviarum]